MLLYSKEKKTDIKMRRMKTSQQVKKETQKFLQKYISKSLERGETARGFLPGPQPPVLVSANTTLAIWQLFQESEAGVCTLVYLVAVGLVQSSTQIVSLVGKGAGLTFGPRVIWMVVVSEFYGVRESLGLMHMHCL